MSGGGEQRVVGRQVGEKQEERGGGGGGQVGLHYPGSLSVEQVGGVGDVVPVRFVISPEVKPPVPALFAEVVLAAAQRTEEVMEAPGKGVVAELAVTEVPLGCETVRQTV